MTPALRPIRCTLSMDPCPEDDGRKAWRIRVESVRRTLRIKFARRVDAAQGIKAIQSMADWGSGDYEAMRDQLDEVGGYPEVRRRIAEAMAW